MEKYIKLNNSEIWTIIDDNIDIKNPFLCLCGGGPGIGDSLLPIDNL